jgi:hypothetical protein
VLVSRPHVPDLLNSLVAFVAEHQRCGELDRGVDPSQLGAERTLARPGRPAKTQDALDTASRSPVAAWQRRTFSLRERGSCCRRGRPDPVPGAL